VSALTIRPMTLDDIESVLPIEQAASSQPWTPGMFQDEIVQHDARVYIVAETGGSVVGFGGLMLAYDEGHITNIAVAPSTQRSGLGTRLLLHLTRAAIARSMKAMTLEVRVSNTAARELYARFGYLPAGIRPKYYADNNEDALIYWAYDVDTAEYGLRLASISERLEARAHL
jgi:[ribosomal protein S18]-alanine N-acetyltransferase